MRQSDLAQEIRNSKSVKDFLDAFNADKEMQARGMTQEDPVRTKRKYTKRKHLKKPEDDIKIPGLPRKRGRPTKEEAAERERLKNAILR